MVLTMDSRMNVRLVTSYKVNDIISRGTNFWAVILERLLILLRYSGRCTSTDQLLLV